jgi:hypothetical protein
MKKTKIRFVSSLVLSALVFIPAGCTSREPEAAPSRVPDEPREIWEFATVTARVDAVDPVGREITLTGPLGNTLTFAVDRRVRRLDEIQAGDMVAIDYYMSLATEIREPTPEEKESPLTVLAGGATAPPGTAPAAGGLRQIKAVVTVEGIDRIAETATLRGPLGGVLTVRVADPARLERVRLGDTVIVTYTEALAVSIEKVQ